MSKSFIINIEGVVFRGSQYLAVMRSEEEEHAGGTLGFAGGTIEDEDKTGDVLVNCLRRELREEVGVEVGNMLYVDSTYFITDSGEEVINLVYLCEHAEGISQAIDPKEVSWVQWMSYTEFLQHPSTPSWVKGYLPKAEAIRQKLLEERN